MDKEGKKWIRNTKFKKGGFSMVSKMILGILCISAVLLLPSAAGCGVTKVIRESDTQGYMLAFAEEGTYRIRVRWSMDGDTWEDADFPNVTASPYHGVGAASDELGALTIIPWTNNSNNIEVVWGLGVTFESSSSVVSTDIAGSAPSAVKGAGDQWLIAYTKAGNAVTVRIYDPSDRGFLPSDFAPIQAKSNAFCRPALVRLRDKVILAWLSGEYMRDSIGFAVGDISESGIPNWTSTYFFNLPSQFRGSCYSDLAPHPEPVLTHDHDRFYLGFIRQTKRCPDVIDRGLVKEDFFLYSSTDGLSWSYNGTKGQIPLYSFVNIAGRSDGSIIVAMVNPQDRGVYNKQVYRWVAGGNPEWTLLDFVFGPYTPQHLQFALVSMGRPPVEGAAP